MSLGTLYISEPVIRSNKCNDYNFGNRILSLRLCILVGILTRYGFGSSNWVVIMDRRLVFQVVVTVASLIFTTGSVLVTIFR